MDHDTVSLQFIIQEDLIRQRINNGDKGFASVPNSFYYKHGIVDCLYYLINAGYLSESKIKRTIGRILKENEKS